MNRQDIDVLRKIVDDAPKNATHIDDEMWYWVSEVFDHSRIFNSAGIPAISTPTFEFFRSLSDIATIIEQHDRIAGLEAENALLKKVEQIFNDSPDLTYDFVKDLFKGELAIFSIEQQAEGVQNAVIKTRRSMHEGGDRWLCRVDDLSNYAENLISDASKL